MSNQKLLFEQLQDSQRLKQPLAKKFAANFTPRRALLRMADAGIPAEKRPDLTQLKNRRLKQATSKSRVVPVRSLADLQKFIASPPKTIRFFTDLVVCNQVPFARSCLADILASCDLTCFVCDFTYKVCQEGLLLEAIGPGGLRITEWGPRMRMVPAFFIIASSDDYPSHSALFELWFRHLDRLGVAVTDGFFDCAAMHHAEKYAQQCGRKFYMRRCLQHVKSNVEEEAARRDQRAGKTRLQNRELMAVIQSWIEFSAGLPQSFTHSGTAFCRRWQAKRWPRIGVSQGWLHWALYQRGIHATLQTPLSQGAKAWSACFQGRRVIGMSASLILIQADEAVQSKVDSGFYSALEQWPRKRGQRIQPDDGEDALKSVSCYLFVGFPFFHLLWSKAFLAARRELPRSNVWTRWPFWIIPRFQDLWAHILRPRASTSYPQAMRRLWFASYRSTSFLVLRRSEKTWWQWWAWR